MKAKRKVQRHRKTQKSARLPDACFSRSLTFERADTESGEVRLAFSTESPVRDFPFEPPVTLLHERDAVDTGSVTSALMNHDPNRIIGRIADVTIDEDRVGRASIVFDEDEESQRARAKVNSGSLRGVSVAYRAERAVRIDEGEEWTSPRGRTFEGPAIVVDRWRVAEISLTPIPADNLAGVGRTSTAEDQSMVISDKLRAALESRGLSTDATDDEALEFLNEKFPGLLESDRSDTNDSPADTLPESTRRSDGNDVNEAAIAEAKRTERKRVSELQRIGRDVEADEATVSRWIDEGLTADEARRSAWNLFRRSNARDVDTTARTELIEDAHSKWTRYVLAGLCNRAGLPVDPNAPNDAPGWLSLHEMIREGCRMRGEVNARSMPIHQLIGTRAFSHATDDFTNLLQNVANKSLRAGYSEAPTTYQTWTRRRDVADFKQVSEVNFGQAQVYLETPELMPIREQSISDARENYTLATYGNKFSISRQALINDDLDGFTRLTTLFGAAARRTINQAVYDHITSNSGVGPTMTEDSIALFATTHTSGSNLAGSGAAPSTTTIAAGREAMRLQAGLGTGAPKLNITPTWVLVPANHEQTVDEILNGAYVPTGSANAPTPNIRSLQLIVEPYLDGISENAWYLLASPTLVDTVVVARLSGQDAPVIQRMDGHDVLGSSWVAYIDFAVQAIDHRGMYRNAGA